MVARKTHRRKTHTKRKTARRVHRRKTIRHRKGGRINMSKNIHNEDKCQQYLRELNELHNNLNTFTSDTVEEELYGKVRALYDDAKRAGCDQNVLDEIEAFENGPVRQRMNALLSN